METRSQLSTRGWKAKRENLYHELENVRKDIDKYSAWAILKLCKLIYNFEQGKLDVSKYTAGTWASQKLPSKWRPLIRGALRVVQGRETPRDRVLLKREARHFLTFGYVRIVAWDSTWDSGRRLQAAHPRKSMRVRKRP
ncbi:MAG TPA: aminoglycoside adenylyltransferase domain-containing protein [Candidatus Bathyarchaeia archaeon]|nr:aminoglycoside adenylyltransferase domain-containing protein [Candidatus Bathyarchaeia archaeon]